MIGALCGLVLLASCGGGSSGSSTGTTCQSGAALTGSTIELSMPLGSSSL